MPTSSDRLLRYGQFPAAKKKYIPLPAIALDPPPLLLVPQSYSYSLSFPRFWSHPIPEPTTALPVKKDRIEGRVRLRLEERVRDWRGAPSIGGLPDEQRKTRPAVAGRVSSYLL